MAAAPANVTFKTMQFDGVKGGWIERGILTVTPAATGVITANLGLECTVDQSLTANVGDQLSVNARGITAGEIPVGARITAQGIGKVTLYNVTGSNITDSNAQTFDYVLVHTQE